MRKSTGSPLSLAFCRQAAMLIRYQHHIRTLQTFLPRRME
jgi:hypothetical protein